jgi:para-aminobenzoate synthetase/4-amino-4-deoxychorismate lyase
MQSSFTLLDDSNASTAEPSSRLYTDLQQVLSCADSAQFDLMMEQMQTASQQGLYAVAVFKYELGMELQGISSFPLGGKEAQSSYILLYKQCQQLSQEQVTSWLQQQVNNNIAGIADLQASVSEAEFTHAIDRIQRYITDGDTYQVNYTFRFHFQTYGTIFSLFQRLRERQPVPFGSLISMPDGSAVLSLSPELFIRHSQGNLSAQPMKGTTAASITSDKKLDEQINAQLSKGLSQDSKNRAENVMIVDLLRNDLGRIAQPGSIHVPKLFEVQRFNTVLQMTSSVTALCREEVSLIDLIKAIYPCGSVTGAPKIRTMQIIHELETEERGIYTGAIGWFDPTTENKIPEFCLSVPIRTMHLQTPTADGMRRGVLGVGAGIVFDSVAASEYQECLLKAQFLTGLPPQFSLFETMYATKEDGCRHWNRHLNRLKHSAYYFGITLNLPEIEKQLNATRSKLADKIAYRLKLSVDGVGQIQIHYAVLVPIENPVHVLFAPTPQQSNSIWLQHKTTHRTEYDQAWQAAEKQGAFDMLFCNERGELTEGARTNILVKIDGHWYTPPLSAGVLPGVMRSVLMNDPAWGLTERTIRVEQLNNADEIVLCNALRGVLPVVGWDAIPAHITGH